MPGGLTHPNIDREIVKAVRRGNFVGGIPKNPSFPVAVPTPIGFRIGEATLAIASSLARAELFPVRSASGGIKGTVTGNGELFGVT
jgi:hypothetical protein